MKVVPNCTRATTRRTFLSNDWGPAYFATVQSHGRDAAREGEDFSANCAVGAAFAGIGGTGGLIANSGANLGMRTLFDHDLLI